MKYLFQVQGSAQDPYTLEFTVKDSVFKANCDCPASIGNMVCKHVLAILEGEIPKGLINGDTGKIHEISEVFQSSEPGSIYKIFKEKEHKIELLKKETKNLKKQLSRMLI